MKKHYFLIIPLLLSCMNIFSQENNSKWRLYLNFQATDATIFNENKQISHWARIKNEEKSSPNLSPGIHVEYLLSNHISLQSGLSVSSLSSESTLNNPDTLAVNWREVPRRHFTETEFNILQVPFGLKLHSGRQNRMKPFLLCGVKIHSVLDYTSVTTDTYYDESKLLYDGSFEKKEFNLFSFSLFGSAGIDYDLSNRFFIGAAAIYNQMIKEIKGRETFANNHYTIGMNEYGAALRFGYIF